ncbi:transcriptional regulator [Kitasatospora purpeofusca]|uniref:ParB/RepB/Spo0J family partition protein n=1 Tax=Kitasatospora purpeofusca TaxID=67352 RepID=UPI0036E2B322
MPIAVLVPGDSPRSGGHDGDHVARLAELDGPLPPILVERRSMRVVDGTHRLLAALLRGEETIEVEFFEGTAEDAFLRAVEANVAHGLPLSHSDRRAAAARIMGSHPYMSDRAIARAAGLGARTVATIRRRSTETVPQLNARVGRDGRVRPVDAADGRRRAAELIAQRPDASLREVARLAGISPATVSDVRRRLESGEPPTGPQSPQPATDSTVPLQRAGSPGEEENPEPLLANRFRQVRLVQSEVNPAAVLEKLLRDPSLRHKEEGRQLLRLLQQNAMGPRELSELISVVPSHCGALVVDLARQCAETWMEFAQELDQRVVQVLPERRRAIVS